MQCSLTGAADASSMTTVAPWARAEATAAWSLAGTSPIGVPGVMMRVVAGATVTGTAGAVVVTGTTGANGVTGTAGADGVTGAPARGAAVAGPLAPDTATGGARAPDTDTGGTVAATVVTGALVLGTGALVVGTGALVVVGGGGVVVGAGITTGTCREGARTLLHSSAGTSKWLSANMAHNAAVVAKTALTLLKFAEIPKAGRWLQDQKGSHIVRNTQYTYWSEKLTAGTSTTWTGAAFSATTTGAAFSATTTGTACFSTATAQHTKQGM